MDKRIWSTLIGILIIASMVLGACTQATPEPTSAPAETQETGGAQATTPPEETQPVEAAGPFEDVDPSGQTVTFWHQHPGDREEALGSIVEDFNANNEYGITVVPEYQGSYGDIFNKMLGVLNTPDAPSLVVAYQNQAATYQLADAMVDMNPLVNSEKWGLTEAEKEDFFQGFFNQDVFPTYGGARLGFPPNRSMEVLYYNQDWLQELGYDAPPATPAEFEEMTCKAAEQPFSKATAEGSIGYELSIDASRLASWTFAFGGDVFDYNTSQFDYTNEAAVNAMSFLQGLFDKGCATEVVESYGDQTDFGAGITLFTVGSSSGLPFYQAAIDEGAQMNWSVAAIPHTTPDPVMNIYGASVSIPKTTPEQELAAWLFLKYYTSPEVQAQWAEVSGYFPVRHSVADEMTTYFEANPAYKAAFDLLQYGKFEPPVPGYDFVRDIAEEAMAAIVNGADVQQTLADMNQEANDILAEQLTSPLPTPVPTEPPEPTATPGPEYGTNDNPIVWAFVPSGETERVATGAEQVADMIYERTGLVIDTFVATEYAGVIEAMCSDPPKAQMGSLATFAYILAADRGCAEAELVSVRFGSPTYNGQIFARADSGIETIADLEGKTFCAVDPLSTSGWIIPSIEIKAAGLDPDTDMEVVFAGSHDAAVSQVLEGECDAGASFVDARTTVEEQYPDVMEQTVIINISVDIPNDGVQYATTFPRELRDEINQALLDIADTEAGQEALDIAYQWESLEEHDDSFYDPFRQVLDAAGVSVEELQ